VDTTYTYLLVNLCSIAIPFAYSFHPKLGFQKTWFAFWPACLITGLFFVVWDVLFTRLGVWGFNPTYLVGIDILYLPAEEWLFFLCIPYACTFTYACFKRLIHRDYLDRVARPLSWGLVVLLGSLALSAEGRLYTTVTFVCTVVFLLIHLLIIRPDYLGRFYLAYGVIFAFPFLIVNGILTGSFTEAPVVWYDDGENLATRVFTIPVEDFIYGLLLYLMNVTLYEAFLSRKATSPVP